jgi:hypothetical protein
MTFSVVWIKAIGKHEFQVGLQTVNQEKEGWGLQFSDFEASVPRPDSLATIREGSETSNSRRQS